MTSYAQEVGRLTAEILRRSELEEAEAHALALTYLEGVEDERLAKGHGAYDIVNGRYERGYADIGDILRDLEAFAEAGYVIDTTKTLDAIIEGMLAALTDDLLFHVTHYVDGYDGAPRLASPGREAA